MLEEMGRYEISHLMGIGIFVFGVLCYWICRILQHVWAWIDDEEVDNRNWIGELIQKSDHDVDDGVLFALILLVVAFIPVTLIVLYDFYIITLSVLIFTIIAHLTRFVRRLSKKFKLHVKDSEAHKEKEDETN